MALQKVFKKSYIDELRNNIRVEDYLQDSFQYDESRCAKLYGIQHPEGLLDKLDPTPEGDLQSAIAIYEAYKDLSPLIAQQDDLWVYLTHVDLFSYVKKRWPIVVDDELEKNKGFIASHWFAPDRFLRMTFASLWWNVYLTVDETREDKYELTKMLFETGQDFKSVRFGESSLIRYKCAMQGILEFLLEHKELVQKNFDPKGQYITRFFNLLGGYKQLAALDKSFFKNELEKRIEILRSINSVDDVQNKEINAKDEK